VYFWQINDGRIWSAEAAKFVEAVPEGAELTPLYDSGQPAGLECLRETIRFYGYGLGELAAPAERILAQIAALEADQTARMTRGAALGKPEDLARLGEIAAGIAALRAELAGL
jgi:hypothetical protein